MAQYPVFCGKDCGGKACPLIAHVDQGRVSHIRHNPAAGRSIRGCPRGFALPLETYAPERILTPLLRTGPRGSGQFCETSWNEALTITVRKLEEIRALYGPEAVLAMNGFGSIGALHDTSTLLNRFLNLYGGGTCLTSNYSNGAAIFTLPYLLGRDWLRSGFDAATMRHAEMIVLWGANVLETRMGAEIPARLLEAKRRGARIVVIGPRHSYTAIRTGAWWIPCRPGTDAALMLSVLHVLITENLAERAFIDKHSTGFTQLERYVLGLDGGQACTSDWAEGICGVDAREIVRFARAYAAAKPALLLPGFAIQRVFAGGEPYRLAVALQIATGNFGVRGGSTGSMNQLLPCPKVGRLEVPPFAMQASVPVVRWPDAIIEGRAGGYPSDVPDLEAFRRTGIYLAPEQERVGLADFAADPEGFPLNTPSGKVEIASRSYARDTGFAAIPVWQPPPLDGRFPLLMVSPKSRHYTHSQSNLPPLRGRRPHALTMNPMDTAKRGIAEGDAARIYNDRGEGIVTVRVSREVMPGVVSLPEGIWMTLDADGVDHAGSANLFTSTWGTVPATANIMHGMAVEVVRA